MLPGRPELPIRDNADSGHLIDPGRTLADVQPAAWDGVAADTTPNVETVIFADLRLESLRMARGSGTVQNLKDRRHDLYTTIWREK